MNHYEVLYLVAANYTEEELKPIRQHVISEIKKIGGEVTFDESFGKKKLAYPIKHNHQGYYLIAEFDAEAEKIKELDRQLRLTNEVLRHIIAKRDINQSSILKFDDDFAGKKTDELMFAKPEKKEPKPAITKTASVTTEPLAPEQKEEKQETPHAKEEDKNEKKKVSLDELDQKLDEILEGDIM